MSETLVKVENVFQEILSKISSVHYGMASGTWKRIALGRMHKVNGRFEKKSFGRKGYQFRIEKGRVPRANRT